VLGIESFRSEEKQERFSTLVYSVVTAIAYEAVTPRPSTRTVQ
jgi:hypothetical protein